MIIVILCVIIIILFCLFIKAQYKSERQIDIEKFKAKKFLSMFQVTNEWLEAKVEGKVLRKVY